MASKHWPLTAEQRVARSRLAFLLLSSALTVLPGSITAQTIVWDAGDPSSPSTENADGAWNNDTGLPTPWRGSGGPVEYATDDDVEFREGSGPADVTVTITEDVAPSSIWFNDSSSGTTTFTIDASDPAHEIFSARGDVGAPNSGLLRILLDDSAAIEAGLNGRFEVRKQVSTSETLTLDGTSASLIRLTVEDDVDLVIGTNGNLSGVIDMDDGDLVINGRAAVVDAAAGTTVLVNVGGEITSFLSNNGSATINGLVDDVTNFGGATTDLNATGEITGVLNNSGTATVAGNVGTLNNNGQLTFDGSMTVGTGGFTNSGGTARVLTGVTIIAESEVNGGTVTVDSGGILQGGVDVLTSGVLVVNGEVVGNVISNNEVTVVGTVTGDVTNQTNGELDSSGTITGTLTNSGDADLTGNVGALTNNSGGTVDVEGATTIAGLVDNSGDLDVFTGITLTATGGIESDGSIDLSDNASIAGAVTNLVGGVVTLQTGTSVAGLVTNQGTLRVNGTASVNSLDSSGLIDLSDGTTGDVLNVAGNATLNGIVEMDVDLSGIPAATSDRLAVAAAVSGNVVLRFDNSSTIFGALQGNITVLTYGSNGGLSFSAQGLAGVGAVTYRLVNVNPSATNPASGEIQISASANPGVGALAGSVSLTQSLIGSVINRPSSPFVTGLAGESDKACHPGVWARALGGKADANGTTRTVDSGGESLVYDSLISASYAGIQLGGDISCAQDLFGNWDLAFGGILGVNTGDTLQPVFAIDTTTGAAITDIIVSNNSTDFQQTYAGVYVSAVRDRFLVDLQYRLEKTQFDLTNDGTGAERIGILDQKFDSSGQTLSGSISYVFPLNEEKGISLVPTLGFALTKTKTDPVAFAGGGRLEVDDASTEVGFLGATLSKSKILPGGNAALTYFATGTYYKDFADPVRSVYYDSTTAAAGAESYSSNLGAYGEASVGINYTQLLKPGAVLNAKQLNASARLDGRFGNTLDSWGVTAQVRLQF